jgi:class 3 adenylate cyclase
MPGRPSGTVTFLFSDVEESTEAIQRLGTAYAAALAEHRRTMREAIERAEGEVVDARGEEHFAVFARAHDAVSAATEIQRVHAGRELTARIGLHTGEPAQDSEGYLGLEVHYAARVCAAGHGGQVLLSAATRALVPEVETRDLGEHGLKGLAAPARLYQLVAPGLREQFPPPRTSRPTEERRRAVAAVAARLHRTKRRSYEDLSWSVRALMAPSNESERAVLARLRTSLIVATRAAADADAYLATADRQALERQLGEYREMSVVSRKAGEQVDRLEQGLLALDALVAVRSSLDDTVYAQRQLPAEAEAAAVAIGRTANGLREARDRTAALIPALSGKLRRTRHRGVYRLGDRWVVPWFDSVGVEHRTAFSTPREAQAFTFAQRMADQRKKLYPGAWDDPRVGP